MIDVARPYMNASHRMFAHSMKLLLLSYNSQMPAPPFNLGTMPHFLFITEIRESKWVMNKKYNRAEDRKLD